MYRSDDSDDGGDSDEGMKVLVRVVVTLHGRSEGGCKLLCNRTN